MEVRLDFNVLQQVLFPSRDFQFLLYFCKQDMGLLFERANEMSDTLSKTLRDAHVVRTLQTEASRSAVDLARSVVELTETTHSELGKINRTAYEIQQQLLQREPRGWPWSDVIYKILAIVWRGKSVKFC
jgi:hypothetical protein